MELVSASTESFAPPAKAPRKWPLLAAVPLALALGYGSYRAYSAYQAPAPYVLVGAKFFTVAPTEMKVKVSKDGDLQAVNNIDVLSLVEGLNTIVEIVKEGTSVKKGDTLVVLDSSGIRQRIEDTSLLVHTAENDLTSARELLQIQEGQNAANLDEAKVEVELAELALKQYEEGTYPQDLASAQTAVEMSKITVANKEDDARQIKDLYAKNFVTYADVKASELGVTTAQNDYTKAVTTLNVLTNYTNKMDLASKRSAVAQARQKLLRTEKENASNLAKARSDVEAKTEALSILRRRADHLKEQLDYCTIKAPAEGLVVYAQTFNGSSGPIQEGTQVRERQPLLRLPDTTEMKAVVKVNETQVTRLLPGQRGTVKVTGVADLLGATLTKISPVADSSQRWWNPDLREYPVELVLDSTPPNLKPGIGVQADIEVESIPDALAVPLAALYAQGADTFVFVKQPGVESVVPRKVKVAQASETHARLGDGVAAGDMILILQAGQGRDLLEKAGITPAENRQPRRKAAPAAAPEKPAALKKPMGETAS